MKKDIVIRKASGEGEIFQMEKLQRSLLNSGAENNTVEIALAKIERSIKPGMSTGQIYKKAFKILKKEKKSGPARYQLKRALMALGPTGYPFEIFIGEFFRAQGYTADTGVILPGMHVTHEMDVIAKRELGGQKEEHLVECKFRSDQGKLVSVQVPLYVRARIDDILKKKRTDPSDQGWKHQGWVVTNTRFSPDSIAFGEGSGLKLLGWDYPSGKGIKDLMNQYKLYPITMLNSLKNNQKTALLDDGIVICSQLRDRFSELRFPPRQLKQLRAELDREGL